MKCTIECYDKNNRLIEYVGAKDENAAREFVEIHKDIYPKIKVTHGLKPDCTKMLEGY